MVGTQDFEDFRTNPDDCETFSYDNEVFYNAVKNSEMTKTDDKTFKFIHIWGAHVPFVFDKDMNRIEDGTYAQNVEACMTMTDAYLKKLKENGVYDNSVIIVMADHGYGFLMDQETDSILFFLLKEKMRAMIIQYQKRLFLMTIYRKHIQDCLMVLQGKMCLTIKKAMKDNEDIFTLSMNMKRFLKNIFRKDMQEIWIH